MPAENSGYSGDWLRIAEKDFARVKSLLTMNDPEGAAFFLQQAVEKHFKAFLLSKGWKLKRTHDLEVLLNAAQSYDDSLEPFRSACQKITAFYIIERYPTVVVTGLTDKDVRNSLLDITALIDKLRAASGTK